MKTYCIEQVNGYGSYDEEKGCFVNETGTQYETYDQAKKVDDLLNSATSIVAYE